MSAAIIPFPARARTDSEADTLRQTRLLIAECWRLREECRRIRRDYEERQRHNMQVLRDAWGRL